MEDLPGLPTVEDLNERIQQAEVRGDATSMIALVMQRQELLDSQREIVELEPVDHAALNDTDAMREALREIKAAETDDQPYADPLAAEVAAKCGVVADDGPPPEQEVQQSTRALAAALMQASTAGPTPDPDDDKEPDQPDSLTAAVAAKLRRKDNRGASNLGLLPNQSKE
jgi:hypothetical protein